MTVPPPVITANRVLVMTLIATSFSSQNSAAIAVAEAQYAEIMVRRCYVWLCGCVGERVAVDSVRGAETSAGGGTGGRPVSWPESQ